MLGLGIVIVLLVAVLVSIDKIKERDKKYLLTIVSGKGTLPLYEEVVRLEEVVEKIEFYQQVNYVRFSNVDIDFVRKKLDNEGYYETYFRKVEIVELDRIKDSNDKVKIIIEEE